MAVVPSAPSVLSGGMATSRVPSPTGFFNLFITAAVDKARPLQVTAHCTMVDNVVCLGTTEAVSNSSIVFTTPLSVEFWFEEVQQIKFTVEDADVNTTNKVLGSAEVILGSIVSSRDGAIISIPGTSVTLRVCAESTAPQDQELILHLCGIDLDST
jgi:hypothetical protein